MAALDFGKVERAQITANQRATGKHHFRQRVETALANGARAVSHTPATFQIFGNYRMVFVALELIKGRQIGVGIGQIHNQTRHYLMVFQMIEK